MRLVDVNFIAIVLGLTMATCSAQDIPDDERTAIEAAVSPFVRPDDVFDIIFESRLEAETGTPMELARAYGAPVRIRGLCRVRYLPLEKVNGQWESAQALVNQALLPSDEGGDGCESRQWDRYISILTPSDDGTLRVVLEGLRDLLIEGEAAEFACPGARPCRMSLDSVESISVVPWQESFHFLVVFDSRGTDGSLVLYVRQATERLGIELVRWSSIID